MIPDSYKNGTDDQKAKWKIVERGQIVFAENCAFCHSSKQPTSGDDLAALQTLRAYYTSGNGQEDEATKKARNGQGVLPNRRGQGRLPRQKRTDG